VTHYEVLGVPPSATLGEIRAAYRQAVRRAHPDTGAHSDGAEIPALTEAWRVLGDPERRREYDRSLRMPAAVAELDDDEVGTPASLAEPGFNPLARYQNPPRFPWRLMAAMAAVGIAVVFIGVATFREPAKQPPDNLLQPGSCVSVEPDRDAVEVLCSAPHDGVVARIVAFDERCPPGEAAHRDAQGLGLACITPRP